MEKLVKQIKLFAKERDWEQFHSPKDLAMAISIESAELLQIFLWSSEIESLNLPKEKMENLKEEIGDIVIYLINLAGKFDIDIIECAKEKIKTNEIKYPKDVVKGRSKKYTEY